MPVTEFWVCTGLENRDSQIVTLPARISIKDAEEICMYFASEPSRAKPTESWARSNTPRVEKNKLAAVKYWRLVVEGKDQRLSVSAAGRELARGGAFHSAVLTYILQKAPPYRAIIESVNQDKAESISPSDVITYWFKHFRSDLSAAKGTQFDQVFCFFHIAAGAGLGELNIGRAGNPSRFKFNLQRVSDFVAGQLQAFDESRQ
jgi:hypothetical protein